jgi:hypothetical protein
MTRNSSSFDRIVFVKAPRGFLYNRLLRAGVWADKASSIAYDSSDKDVKARIRFLEPSVLFVTN